MVKTVWIHEFMIVHNLVVHGILIQIRGDGTAVSVSRKYKRSEEKDGLDDTKGDVCPCPSHCS